MMRKALRVAAPTIPFSCHIRTGFGIVGKVFVGVVIFFAIFIGGFLYLCMRCNASAKAYVDENIPPIVSTWSSGELERRESDRLREAVSDEQMENLFRRFADLGPMKAYNGASGMATLNTTYGGGLFVTAQYLVKASFQNGKAEIKISCFDGWKVAHPGFSRRFADLLQVTVKTKTRGERNPRAFNLVLPT